MRPPAVRKRAAVMAQRGVTLVEALLAFLVLAVGVLSMSKLHLHLQSHADVARQRATAVRLAQEHIESWRAAGAVRAPTPAPLEAIDDARDTRDADIDTMNGRALNTAFRLTRRVDASGSDALQAGTVTVAWTARDGSAQRSVFHPLIAAGSATLTGALALGPSARASRAGDVRARGIPAQAKDLGDGRSVWKPGALGTVVFVFDNESAQVTLRCTEVPAALSTAGLTAAHLTDCRDASGSWVSGTVRFSNADTPDPASANDTPLGLSMTLSATVGGAAPETPPWCVAEAQKAVIYRAADGTHRDAVPLSAEPADLGLSEWTDTGERFVAYACVVPSGNAPAPWSGVTTVVPLGWTLGGAATDRQVCRYTADLDGSGAIDRNDEHPARYLNVDRALQQQNFLVIRGDLTCPGDTAARIASSAPGAVAELATAPHQP